VLRVAKNSIGADCKLLLMASTSTLACPGRTVRV
jgi:hypothetical protein